MTDLRVLPPGGGDGDGPDDDEFNPSYAAAAMADKAMALAEQLRPIERRFAEHYAATGDSHEAVLALWPDLAKRGPAAINRKLGNLLTTPNIRAYIEAIRGFGALSIGLSYATVLLHLYDEGTNQSNSPNARILALTSLENGMRQSGIAAAEGFAKPDKKALEGARGSAAVPKEAADQWLEMLSSSPPVPKRRSGGDAG